MKLIRRRVLFLIFVVLLTISMFSAQAFAAHTHNDITFDKEWTSGNSLPSSSGSYYLTKPVTLSSTWTVPNDATINLCLNGCTISSASSSGTIKVTNNSTLRIYDCDPKNGGIIENTYNGTWRTYGRTINISAFEVNITIEIYGGTIQSKSNAAIFVTQTDGTCTCTIKSGTFIGKQYGAAHIRGGNFNVDGGTFSGDIGVLMQPDSNGSITSVISGGTFLGKTNAVQVDKQVGSLALAISGGIYSSKPLDD